MRAGVWTLWPRPVGQPILAAAGFQPALAGRSPALEFLVRPKGADHQWGKDPLK